MSQASDPLRRAADVMRAVRERCVWTQQITHRDLIPYLVEESAELIDAVEDGTRADMREELGDLLWQVLFHAEIASRDQLDPFDIDDVAAGLAEKMVRRHPHVFGDAHYANAAEQARGWDEIKRAERAAAGDGDEDASVLAGISRGLPEWKRALKLCDQAATVGFDWPGPEPVLDKLEEEIGEVRAEFAAGAAHERLLDEIGDVAFVLVNLARHAGVDFSQALRHANAKFERRFRRMEQLAAEAGEGLTGKSLAEQDALWDRAKAEER